MGHVAKGCLVEYGQDIPRTQRSPALVWVVKEIDRRHSARQHVHVADPHKSRTKVVTPFLRGKRVVHEGADVLVGIRAGWSGQPFTADWKA